MRSSGCSSFLKTNELCNRSLKGKIVMIFMAQWVLSRIQHLWPFASKKTDDLKVSDGLVGALLVPESTKQFVFALRDPDSLSVVYLLAAESLSERSASDAEFLVKAVKPKVVIGQIGPSSLDDVRAEESNLSSDNACSVPTSLLGVVKCCFLEKINWSKYESRAGSQVLQTIFGTGFYGHVLSAKQAAIENNSLFLFLETPYRNGQANKLDAVESEQPSNQNGQHTSALTSFAEISQSSAFFGQVKALQGDVVLNVPMGYKRYPMSDSLHSSVKALASSVALSLQNSLTLDQESQAVSNARSDSSTAPSGRDADDQIPSFAHSFYSLLVDLHEMFNNLPAVDKALGCARKMLGDVEQGKEIDCQVLSQVNKFRIAVEGLRVALNSAARTPIKEEEKNLKNANFDDLPYEEKCHVLFAQALRRQARQSDTVVAIVDASSLSGIRKYWTSPVPEAIADLAEECFISGYSDDDANGDDSESRRRLVDKPVIAVGAGAATVLGVSSFSKIVPVSSFMKIVTLKVPAIMKLGLLQTKRSAAAIMAAAAEKLRLATHSIIASAERSSLSAMRTAFYGIMRKRVGRASGASPWITFGGSILTCAGLLAYGDGIECAAELAPAMPTIARLGREGKVICSSTFQHQNEIRLNLNFNTYILWICSNSVNESVIVVPDVSFMQY
ncbi:hypothetical protein SUGI_0409730 [Cryptomeria japonica]|nr:hypothetical protein SUGI_0409730 [Cryptomeria japonica]